MGQKADPGSFKILCTLRDGFPASRRFWIIWQTLRIVLERKSAIGSIRALVFFHVYTLMVSSC